MNYNIMESTASENQKTQSKARRTKTGSNDLQQANYTNQTPKNLSLKFSQDLILVEYGAILLEISLQPVSAKGWLLAHCIDRPHPKLIFVKDLWTYETFRSQTQTQIKVGK